MEVFNCGRLVYRWRNLTYIWRYDIAEDQTVSDLQIYMAVVPVFLVAFFGAVTWWTLKH
jgi:hypothetical protein